jgi:hypothetical protein
MANNYTQFSFKLPWDKTIMDDVYEGFCLMGEDTDEAIALKKEIFGDDWDLDFTINGIDIEENYISCEENGCIENLVTFLRYYMNKHNIQGKFGFEYAFTCSKMCPDQFGGGAVCFSKDDEEWMNCGTWLAEKMHGW